MSTVFQPTYFATQTAITIAPENVASSATFVAGVESNVISNISALYDEVNVSGIWRCGTTPTANTVVQIFVYVPMTDDLGSTVTYPDVLDGASSAETFTSVGVMSSSVYFLGSLFVDTNTSARDYFLRPTPVFATIGFVPTRWGLFITHNTGVNSDTTAGNHKWYYTPTQYQGI